MGYDWFVSSAISQVSAKLQEGDTIVINLGVNDLGNISKYISKINELASGEWKDYKLIYMSVNPVLDYKSTIKNTQIESFNSKMKSGLSSSVKYVDTYSQIKDTMETSDGLHYASSTYLKLYNLVRNSESSGSFTCSAYGGQGLIDFSPDFSVTANWTSPLNPFQYGQCTWYTAGAVNQVYGTGFLDFTGKTNPWYDGQYWVELICKYYPDKFYFSTDPKPGAIFSTSNGGGTYASNHVGFIIAVDGDNVTYFDGNYNGKSDGWDYAVNYDWKIQTTTKADMQTRFKAIYANPITDVTGSAE
jgi:surface antigen